MNTAPEKPRFGSPCNGCGFCCAAQTCRVGIAVGATQDGPCEFMEFEDGRFHCGVFRNAASDQQPLLALIMGIGAGCDSDDHESTDSDRNGHD